jgi:hypothetical protein
MEENRMKSRKIPTLLLLAICTSGTIFCDTSAASPQENEAHLPKGFIPLFNGADLTGWEGDQNLFRAEDKKIIAGQSGKEIPESAFLCTTQAFDNFELRLQLKDTENAIDGAVVVRAKRVKEDTQVQGYLIDSGELNTKMILGFEGFLSEEIISAAGINDQETTKLWGAL